jgi:hypothetical protein
MRRESNIGTCPIWATVPTITQVAPVRLNFTSWFVLHRGESLSLPLDIGKYVDLSDSKQYAGARFPAGNYSLQAELPTETSDILKSMLKTTNVWMGRAISNTVQTQFASEFLAPLDDYPW